MAEKPVGSDQLAAIRKSLSFRIPKGEKSRGFVNGQQETGRSVNRESGIGNRRGKSKKTMAGKTGGRKQLTAGRKSPKTGKRSTVNSKRKDQGNRKSLSF